MAEIFPNEGLDYILSIFPKNGANASTLYMGLFTGATEDTVPAETATLAAPSGFAEPTYTGYARVSIASSAWGSPANTSGTDGREVQATQVTFAAAGNSFPTAINGFFIATDDEDGVAIYYSNFVDGAIDSLALGDVIKVTPKLGFLQ